MLKIKKRLVTAIITSSVLTTSVYANDELKQRAQKSKMVVQEFMGQLKGELQAAMKAAGPIHAIDVYHKKAPAIASQLSEKYGWDISRTSLKARNPNNQPDAWEREVLNSFEARKANGEEVKPMAHFEMLEQNGQQVFRFMKAIPTGQFCLTCHGETISAELKAKINELYPNDKATGFKASDIRGAFSITQPM